MRLGILAPLLLSTLAAPGDAPERPVEGPPAYRPRVEVLVRSGRAQLARGREVLSIEARGEPLALGGAAHLELGARSEVEVAWRGVAGLRVRGPASFAVVPGKKDPLAPRIEVRFARSLELEVRRGAPTLILGQGWELAPGPGAFGLRELADGTAELVHHGGRPVRVQSLLERPRGWPREIPSGCRVRLPAAR